MTDLESKTHAGDNPAPPTLLQSAQSLLPLVAGAAERAERDRTLPAEVVEAFIDAGLFRLCVPRAVGGLEADPVTLLGIIETIATADGSAGWCLMIGATSGALAGWLPEDVARVVYGDPRAVTGGVFAPRGRAVAAGDSFTVTGRWPFASGSAHCAWLSGGCVIEEDSGLRLGADGRPDPHLLLIPAAEVTIHDTWRVSGLRGTGSHDIEVAEVQVPRERAVPLVSGQPLQTGALYSFPIFGLLAAGIAAVALGIGRAAITDLTSLADGTATGAAGRALRDRPGIQRDVARAEAAVRAARALLLDTVERADAEAGAGGVMSVERRTDLRLAATHATAAAADAVDLMYHAGGSAAVYDSSPLQRRFRDIHVATQHMMVAAATWELTGRLLLGVTTDTATL